MYAGQKIDFRSLVHLVDRWTFYFVLCRVTCTISVNELRQVTQLGECLETLTHPLDLEASEMKSFEWVISRLENFFESITVILMLAMMFIVFFDVVSRYLFNSPLAWAFDLIGLYLMVGVFFLSLSRTFTVHGHVGVDILLHRASPKLRRLAAIATCVFSIPFFGLLAFISSQRAYQSWINDDALSGLIAWPTWVAEVLVPIGTLLLMLRLIFALIGHVMSLQSGRDVIALEPLAGHGLE